MTTISAKAGEAADEILRRQVAGLLEGVTETDDQRAVWEVTLATAEAGLTQLAALPLSINVNWPAGVNAAQRKTMEAQLQFELQRAAIDRLAAELRVLFSLAPGVALGLTARFGDIEARQAAGKTIAQLTAPASLTQRISSALRSRRPNRRG